MRTVFRPKHTVFSVAKQLHSGLLEGNLLLERAASEGTFPHQILGSESSEETISRKSIFVGSCIFAAVVAFLLYASPDSARLNIGISLMMLATGVGMLFLSPPKIFNRFPYTRQAFILWTLRWLLLGAIWTFWSYLPHDKHVILMLVDLGSLLSIGFSWAFFSGRQLAAREFTYLSVIFATLLLWNFFEPQGRQIWLAPSEIVSVAAILLTASAVALRYGLPASYFLCIMLTSALFQIPTYNQVFLDVSSPNFERIAGPALAASKLFSGSILYALFKTESPNEELVGFPLKIANILRKPVVAFSIPFLAIIGLLLNPRYASAISALLNQNWRLLLIALIPIWIWFKFRQTPILLVSVPVVFIVFAAHHKFMLDDARLRYLLVASIIFGSCFWIPLFIFKWDAARIYRQKPGQIESRRAA
jgi:hypothetical protein